MIKVHVSMKFTGEPFKRVPVTIIPDADPGHPLQAFTDRAGVALFEDAAAMPGKIMVDGVARHQVIWRVRSRSNCVHYWILHRSAKRVEPFL